jgi:hypothetical protein
MDMHYQFFCGLFNDRSLVEVLNRLLNSDIDENRAMI